MVPKTRDASYYSTEKLLWQKAGETDIIQSGSNNHL